MAKTKKVDFYLGEELIKNQEQQIRLLNEKVELLEEIIDVLKNS